MTIVDKFMRQHSLTEDEYLELLNLVNRGSRIRLVNSSDSN